MMFVQTIDISISISIPFTINNMSWIIANINVLSLEINTE